MRFCVKDGVQLAIIIIIITIIAATVSTTNNATVNSNYFWKQELIRPEAVAQSTTTDNAAARRKRESGNPEFTWKVTKTPKFVTAKTEKPSEPILKFYPPDTVYRNGRARDQSTPQRTTPGGRIIYYATLPDVARYTPSSPANTPYGIGGNNFRANYIHSNNQQRSYNPPIKGGAGVGGGSGGKDFVTRVQSSIIDVRPRGENKKQDFINSTPTFTIVDANPTYSYNGGNAGGFHPDYNFISDVERINYNYMLPYLNEKAQYYPHHHMPYRPPQHYRNPYYGHLDKTSHYQQQFSPYQQYPLQQAQQYYFNEIGKIPSPSAYYNPPPYPSRHTRFPVDRYPATSALGQYGIAGIQPIPAAAPTPSQQSSLNIINDDDNFHSYPLNLESGDGAGAGGSVGNGAGGGNSGPSSNPSFGFDLSNNNHLGPSLNHNSDLEEYQAFGGPFKDKFLEYQKFYSTISPFPQKYLNFNNFGNEFPFKDTFKFDKEPFKGPFSQVSDWLTNKPFDVSSLDLDEFTRNPTDYKIKGSSTILGTRMYNQTNTVKDANNTIITPFSSSSNDGAADINNLLSQSEGNSNDTS